MDERGALAQAPTREESGSLVKGANQPKERLLSMFNIINSFIKRLQKAAVLRFRPSIVVSQYYSKMCKERFKKWIFDLDNRLFYRVLCILFGLGGVLPTW